MKRLLLSLLLAAAPMSFAVAADTAADKEHPPTKAMDSATPQMKNPDGTKNLLPPQKAMDEATPAEKTADKASEGGSKTWNAADARKAQKPPEKSFR